MDLDDFMKKKPADKQSGGLDPFGEQPAPDFGGLDDPVPPGGGGMDFGGLDEPVAPSGGDMGFGGLDDAPSAPAPLDDTDPFGEPVVETGSDPAGFDFNPPSSAFPSADEFSAMGEPEHHKKSFFRYIKNGGQIAMLKGDVIDRVSGDPVAFVPALVVLLLPSVIAGVLMMAMMTFLTGMMSSAGAESGMPEAFGAVMSAMGPAVGAGMLVLLPLIALVSTLVLVGLIHLLAKIMKGDGSFLDLYQTIGLGSIVTYGGIIPYVGIVFQLWMIPVSVVVTSRVHGISTGKAVAAVLIPIVLFVAIALGLVFAAGMSALAGMGGVMQPM